MDTDTMVKALQTNKVDLFMGVKKADDKPYIDPRNRMFVHMKADALQKSGGKPTLLRYHDQREHVLLPNGQLINRTRGKPADVSTRQYKKQLKAARRKVAA